jgi:predicted helicase
MTTWHAIREGHDEERREADTGAREIRARPGGLRRAPHHPRGRGTHGFQTLLAECAPDGWKLIHEERLANGIRPDGTMHDDYNLRRGYWEAKDTHDDLDTEIHAKISRGYPTSNIIFEDTQRAVLYQGGKRSDGEIDLRDRRQLTYLLETFFGYEESHIVNFHQAVAEFGANIKDLAAGLKRRIEEERLAHNRAFDAAWAKFYELCRTALDPNMRSETVDDMLVQHLLTERLFRTVFDNPHFLDNNVIAVEIEKVIAALTSRAFNRSDFLRARDRFYLAIEQEARRQTSWDEKQAFMNTVYERFFQDWSKRQADTHGIVYTPQEIVDFMCASVDEVLRRDFGMSLSAPGVSVLDPATGTGSFVVNLLRRIDGSALQQKYQHELFANEIMLLPYYIASLNIEHAYYERTQQYLQFPGICFADTLELADPLAHTGHTQQSMWVNEQNTERVRAEQDAKIMVVIGNPPYNMGQMNENDNNKNRSYAVIDRRIHDTYAKDSKATLNNKLYDAYVKFFRWATDRLGERDGVVCMVTNNSFIDQIAFDGMRQHLLNNFTAIYHIDLHGDVRLNPKLSGTTHNVFGIQVGVGITVAIRSTAGHTRGLYYFRVPEGWRKDQKLDFLKEHGSISAVEWQQLCSSPRILVHSIG